MPPKKFSVTTGSKEEPRSQKKLASGGQDIRELISSMNAEIDATPIHEMTAEEASDTRRVMWNKFIPWNNIELLLRGFDLWVLPERPVYVSTRRPIFVINVAPAGSGKSRILQILSETRIFHGFAPIVVDPDELNEFFVEVFGYHPPKTDFEPVCRPDADAGADSCCLGVATGQTGWWTRNRGNFTNYERVFSPLPGGDNIRKGNRIREIAPACCIAKTYNITTKYGEILGNPRVIDYIFERAINPDGSTNYSDIVFDSTGGGMKDVITTYITRATELGYEIVIAGMFSTPENCSIRAESRNGRQHRRMNGGLVFKLAQDFRSKQTIFDWEEFSRRHKCRFILAENNWLPDRAGQAKLVFHRTPNGDVQYIDETSVLLTPTGFYGMRFDIDSETFFGQKTVTAEKDKRGGTSRKRRISRRRLHGSRRVRKTVKKYYRPVTRRHRGRHSHFRR